MHKDSLYKLNVVPLKPKEKGFKIDRIFSDYEHTVVRLPPYMCDLNPIELAWAKIKRIVWEHNVTADLSLQKLLQTAHDAIGQVNQEDWEGFCQHVEFLEKQCWEMDGIVPDVIDSIVINVGSDSDSDSVSESGSEGSACAGEDSD
jgi:hypothetical protein